MTDIDDDFDSQMIEADCDSGLNFNAAFPDVPISVCKYVTENELNAFFNFSDTSSMNILHINCRSIKKNYNSIINVLHMFKAPLSAIAVSESWLTESVHDVYSIPGYNFYAKSRTDKIGGGVGLYVSNIFDCKIHSDLCRMTEYLECIFLECRKVGCQSFIIGSIYRPPNSDLEQFNFDLLSILEYASGMNKLAIIAGDFNRNLLNSDSHPPTREFVNNLLSCNFLPTIHNPTRISDKSATLIDNIFVNCVKCKYSSAIVYSDISDHLPVALHLTANLPKVEKTDSISKRFFDTRSIEEFNIQLSNTSWDEINETMIFNPDPNCAYELFFKIYNDIFNKHFPVKKFKALKPNDATA
jgi:hypothetical protein